MAHSDTAPNFVVDTGETRVTVYMGFVSFMILIWEHIITFGDEVEYIWKGRKSFIVWLFFLNRYLTPLGFIINLFAYLSPSWTQEVRQDIILTFYTISCPILCERFVRYEGSMTVIGLNTTAIMMFLRVYALYPTRYVVLAIVGIVFCAELAVNAWLLSHGQAVIHDSRIHACTMIFDPSLGDIASASAWLPLLYDTIVLAFILKRTLQPVRRRAAGKIMTVLLRDGLLYYSVIFSINLVLTLMIALAPPGIQNITAQLEYLLTVAMMSRITLHLKKQGRMNGMISDVKRNSVPSNVHHSHLRFARSHHGVTSTVNPEVTVTIEELVTHDDGSASLDNSDRPGSIGQQSKRVEWHEMENMNRGPNPVV
ncbi:unnamed protein product [Somion occarium]|uniref:DUF6533 domain-containing protein n=1 Tax=Somion occarium TaxID=3059160 RepID=A0ABP1E2S4_9APHY